jgi:CBS-domain-containing membrane protein
MINIGYRRIFAFKTAKKLINKHKSTVKLQEPINKVITLIYKEGFHYIPVLNNQKKVVGVITPSSILNLLEEY